MTTEMKNHSRKALSFRFSICPAILFRILLLILCLAPVLKSGAQTVDTAQIRQLEKSGDQLRGAQKYKDAVDVYQQTIALSDKAGFHTLFVPAIYPKIAECYEKQTRIDSATVYYRKASRIYNDQLPDTNSEAALRPIINFSQFFNTWRVLDSAIYYADLALRRSGPLTDSTLIQSDIWITWGNPRLNADRFDEAITAYNNTLAIRQKRASKEPIKIYQPIYSLGTVYRSKGNPDEARALQLKALPYAEAASDKMRVSNCLRELGWCDYQQGKYEDAVAYWKKVIELRSVIFGPDHPRLCEDFKNLGDGLLMMRQTEEALANFEKAIYLAEKRYTPTHLDLANNYSSYAMGLTAAGRYDQAIAFCNKALSIQKKNKSNMAIAHSLYTIGVIYTNLIQYDSSALYLERSLEVLKTNNLTQTGLMREVSHITSRLYSILDNYPRARVIAEDAINTMKSKQYSVVSDVQLSTALGVALGLMDSLDKADALFQHALDLVGFDPKDTLFTKAIPFYYGDAVRLKAWYLLQRIQKGERDKIPEALRLIEMVRRYADYNLENTPATISRNSQTLADYFKYYTGVQLYMEAGMPEKAVELIESVKARNIFAEIATRNTPEPEGFPVEWNQQEQALRLSVSNMRQQIGNATATEKDSLARQIYDGMSKLQAIRAKIKSAYPDYFRKKNGIPIADLKRFRREDLDQQTVMVEYFLRRNKLHTILITKDTICSWFQQLKEPVSAKVDRYLKLIYAENRIDVVPLDQLKTSSYELYQLLLAEPLKVAGAGVKKLMIATDESIGAIPFGALLNSLPAGREPDKWPFLIKKYDIRYTSSISTLQQQEAADRKRPGKGFIGFAPIYSASDSMLGDARRGALIRVGSYDLPNARREVQEISAMMGGKAVLDTAATESAFREQYKRYGIIHLAMHGIPNQLQPDFSKLLFLSGKPNAAREADGDLTAAEILALQVPAQLVVLSACQSGAGRWIPGEGVLSLSYSFASAGASAVVSSLWEANDPKTKDLMVDFYRELKAGKPKDEALRTAQLRMIARAGEDPALAHPYFWAPFVLYGSNKPLR